MLLRGHKEVRFKRIFLVLVYPDVEPLGSTGTSGLAHGKRAIERHLLPLSVDVGVKAA